MGLNREILRLAIPSILANITVPLVGMVDIAVAGHLDGIPDGLSAAAFIGAIAVGTTLFDLLYWNFAFLRSGTGGLTAQAYGRGDRADCAKILCRALNIALGIAMLLIAIQWLFVNFAFLFVRCSPEVRDLASTYFHIRIWAAPATLSLMAFKGWFIGMQDSVAAMTTDLVVNGVNIVASILLARWLGFKGIALGTVTAQFSGVLTAACFLAFRYRRVLLALGEARKERLRAVLESFHGSDMSRFFKINRDIFVRSLCFIAIYIGYTAIAAPMGDVLLSVSAILMKILMLFSYFTDGFAYAGEAMTGKYIGAGDREKMRGTVRRVFEWSMGIAVLFMGIYGFGGRLLTGLMTKDAAVLDACMEYIPWLLLMPPFGCAAFAWDGIFIGATASKGIRNAMIVAAIAFFSVWGIGSLLLQRSDSLMLSSRWGLHVLMAAYFAHLLARTIYLSAAYRKDVLYRFC